MSSPITLAPESVEAIAERVAELLAGAHSTARLVTADEVASRFSVSRDYVYEHAEELGAIPMGPTGKDRKPRLRFDLERVAEALAPKPFTTPASPTAPPKRRRSPRSKVELLPIGRRP